MSRRQPPGSVAYVAVLPAELHAALKKAAEDHAAKNGGQKNINRQIVQTVYAAYKSTLTNAQKSAVDTFLTQI